MNFWYFFNFSPNEQGLNNLELMLTTRSRVASRSGIVLSTRFNQEERTRFEAMNRAEQVEFVAQVMARSMGGEIDPEDAFPQSVGPRLLAYLAQPATFSFED